MSLSYIDWIEKYNLNFQLHIKEEKESDIYSQIDLEEVTENLMTFNNTIVDVVSTSKVNNKYYYKIKYKNNLIGWCSPESNTVAYVKHPKQEIKIKNNNNIDNELNKTLEIQTDKLKENWFKIFFSDFYAIYNNKIYCAIILKDDLLGFILLDDISFFTNYRNEFTFTSEKINLFKDSKMEKIIIEDFEHKNNIYNSLGVFENFDGVRVVVDGKRYWVNINNTNLNIEHSRIETIEEIIIDALMYQLKDKVKMQNEFYSTKISNLRDRISELEEKEKQTKKNIKKLKEIL